MKNQKYFSKIDSNRFQFKIARINDYSEDIPALLRELKAAKYELIISRIDTKDKDTINRLTENGFKIMDVGLTYSHNLEGIESMIIEDPGDEVTIRLFKDSDLQKLIFITLEAFEGYGHYFADTKLNKQFCRDTYVDWITNSCFSHSSENNVFVAEYNNEIAGYFAVKFVSIQKEKILDGGLGAVFSRYRNYGVFNKLLFRSMVWAKENGALREEGRVLATNYPVNKSYSNLGFCIKSSFITLHGWL